MQPHPDDWRAEIQVTALDLCLAPEAPWRLPADPALLLRATLGNALYGLCCVTEHQDCGICTLRERCEIPAWFEPGGSAPRPVLPMAITPGGARVGPEAPWLARLWLLGVAPRPSLIPQAIVRLARAGLGRERVPHRVAHLTAHGASPVLVLEDERERAPMPAPGRLLDHCATGRATRLETVTPLCLDTASPTVGDLVRAAIGRVRQQARAQGRVVERRWPEPDGLERPWDAARWVEDRRVSSKGGPHDLSGWVGRITLDASLSPWADLLVACEVLGVGKNLSAGRGRYRLA